MLRIRQLGTKVAQAAGWQIEIFAEPTAAMAGWRARRRPREGPRELTRGANIACSMSVQVSRSVIFAKGK
jgi:hypothetical protein